METKKSYLSKTLWINLVIAAIAFFPAASQFCANNPEAVLTGMALVNVILRFVTKGKVELA